MCGRFTLRIKLNLLLSQFAAELAEMDWSDWEPRYNIAQGTKAPQVAAVRLVDGKRQLARLHWPLVPSWEKSKKLKYSTYNARAETMATKPAYRAAYRKRRCLVLADGYVEWEERGEDKLPWLYEIDGGAAFAIAGLWETWRDPNDPTAPLHESCTLIVTEGNDFTRRIGHERMPVILHAEDYDAWLHCEEIPLVPFPADRMTERRTSTYINNSRNQGPQCIAPPE